MSKDLTHLIERKTQTEERLGIVVQGLSATAVNVSEMHVCGEITPVKGEEIDCSFELVIAVYDSEGRVRESRKVYVYRDDFYVISTFEELFLGKIDTKYISKIVVFCKSK